MQTIKDFDINALRSIDPNNDKPERYMPYTYLMSERRYRAMTTNISKCFNGVLKGARSLPIAAMVEFTRCKLVAYFHDRHKEITYDLSQGKVWSDYAMGINAKNVHKATGHTIRAFNHEAGIYQVLTLYNDYSGGGGNHSHEINILARTRGYG